METKVYTEHEKGITQIYTNHVIIPTKHIYNDIVTFKAKTGFKNVIIQHFKI